MTDWGGPIGLDFARKHPERVKRLVIANTWCWPVRDDFHFKSFSFLMSSWIGQYLLRHHNILVNGVMPKAVGDRSALTPEIMAHYRSAQPSPPARAASAALPGYIVGRERLAALDLAGPRRLRGQAGAHSLGHEGHRVPEEGTERWKSALRDVEIREFEDCGHFLWQKRRRASSQQRCGRSWGARRAFVTPNSWWFLLRGTPGLHSDPAAAARAPAP